MNNTSLFLKDLFITRSKIYTGSRTKNETQNAKTIGSYIWCSDYSEEPQFILVKEIYHKDFEKDLKFIQDHELYSDKILFEGKIGLVYNMSNMWLDRLYKLTKGDLTWLPKEAKENYPFFEVLKRTEKGYNYYKKMLSIYGFTEAELEMHAKDAKDGRNLYLPFIFKNECINPTEQDELKFNEWCNSRAEQDLKLQG